MMTATILQWNVRGLRSNRRDFDILVGELQPEVICLQETKLEQSPEPKTFQCANYDCYNTTLRRRPEQLPCGGVSIYVKKGLYHKPIQLGTHLQAVAVQVTLGGSPVTILSVYTPSPDHLTTQDLSRLIRGLNGQILITGDLNGHSYSWGNLNNDTRGDVIESFTDRNNLCILNDGSPTYLKPQAQHSQNPTSAIDLSICTPGLALKCAWEVLPDTHGSDHYPILISQPPTSGDTNQGGDPSHWVFSKADWEQFADLCMDKITSDILHDQDPLSSFVGHVIDAATDSIPRATTVPKKSNPWFDEECREMLKTRRALDRKVHRGGGPRAETLMTFRRTQAQARRLFTQKKRESWTSYVSQLNTNTPIKYVWNRVRKISGKNVCPPKQYLKGKDGAPITDPKDIANKHAATFTDNSSSAHYSARFQTIKAQDEKARIDFTSDNTEVYNKPFRLRDLRCSILKAKPRAPGPDGIHNNLLKPPQSVVTLLQLGGLRVSKTPEAMPAGVLTPGRFDHAGQALR